MIARHLKVLIYSFVLAGVLLCFLSVTSYAAASACDLKPGAGALSVPTWYQYLPGEVDAYGNCKVASNLEGKYFVLIGMAVFDILLFLAGFIAVIMVIFGGFKFLTSTGEPQKIAGARTTIFNALIGLAIAIIASQLVGFIAGRLM